MGILGALVLMLSAALLSISTRNVLQGLRVGVFPEETWAMLGFGVLLTVLGGAALVARSKQEPAQEDAPQTPALGFLAFGVALWLGAPLLAWVQFELYRPTLYMFPITGLVGAVLTTWVAVRALLRTQTPVVRASSPMLIVLFAVPMATTTFILPKAHFLHHLSTVNVVWMGDDFEGAQVLEYLPDVPDSPDPPSEMTGTLKVLSALADAKPVDVSAKIKSGEWKYGEDGELLEVLVNVEARPLNLHSSTKTLQEMESRANRKEREAYEAKVAAHKKLIELRRRGGRLLSAGP